MAPFKAVDSKAKFRGVYYLDPTRVGSLESWRDRCQRCRSIGFDHLAVPPPFAPGPACDWFLAGDLENAHPALRRIAAREDEAGVDAVIEVLADAAQAAGLGLLVDIVVDRVDGEGALARSEPTIFERPTPVVLDPRAPPAIRDAAFADFDRSENASQLLALWRARLAALSRAGVAGFRFVHMDGAPPSFWRALVEDIHDILPAALLLGFTPGMAWDDIEALADIGLDGVFSSLPWWDRRAGWFAEELDLLRRVAPVIACPEVPFGPRLARAIRDEQDVEMACRQALAIAAATGDVLMIPMGFDHAAREPLPIRPDGLAAAPSFAHGGGLENDIGAALQRLATIARLVARGETRAFDTGDSGATCLIRHGAPDARTSPHAAVVAINPDLAREQPLGLPLDPITPAAGAPLGGAATLDGGAPQATLAPGEVRVVILKRLDPILRECPVEPSRLTEALMAPRIVIEAISPSVDGGRFAVKRLNGETISVAADIFTDGHGVIDAELLWKAGDAPDWQRVPMRQGNNDRWTASFTPGRIGRHWVTIEVWLDGFASLCRDLEIKRGAGLDIGIELIEAQKSIEAAQNASQPPLKSSLSSVLTSMAGADQARAAEIVLAPGTRALMRRAGPRQFLSRHDPPIAFEIERPQAGFAAWYELFPRSTSPTPGRHGSFNDVIARLPEIRAMGFDVLYLTPIHPIGRTNRKGRNNSLTAGPDDPGSPYAIGAEEGGHDAIHPELGTFDDFRHLIAAAREQGLEIALDFAIQCSPDHPWLTQHPEWFSWRPDGSLRFAENPPKKYEDIVNVDFYAGSAARALWTALRNIVLFWVEHGIRIFRVDNPHTKPLPFWQWLIADIRARAPDVIFLSEAFTRPKMMHRLAKIGFSQSYTYFTWRNAKRELIEYLTELSTPPVADYLRPHFFVNTPDINPYFLQQSGRAGFLIRAVLAATLSGLWGIYSGFELCEGAALPGREEYLDSEKYEIRQRDLRAPGNIGAEIATLNRLRKRHGALQSHTGLTFYNAFNDQILLYGKMAAPNREMVLVAVSLDPHRVQEAIFELPLWEWGLGDEGSLAVDDLITERRFVWTGKLQKLRLDPAILPYAIWRLAPLPETSP